MNKGCDARQDQLRCLDFRPGGMDGKTYLPVKPGSPVAMAGGKYVCRAPSCMTAGWCQQKSRAKPKGEAAAAAAPSTELRDRIRGQK